MTNGVYSKFELRELGIKTSGSEAYKSANCVGSAEEEMDTKVVTKSCRGIVSKKKVRGTGTGKVSLSLHMPYEIYVDMFGMTLTTLIEGVKAYGSNSVHKEFAMTEHVYDEDGEEMFRAYPRGIVESGIATKIENGGEEVAEIELEVSIMPDEFGNGVYEALASELDEETKGKWMTAFEPSMVQVKEA